MKVIHYMMAIGLFAMVACSVNQPVNHPQYFEKPEEAVKKAQSDLLEAMKVGKNEFNFGIDPRELKEAQIGPMIQNYELNFDALLKADQTVALSELVDKVKNQLVPLHIQNRVITVVELKKEEKGWIITGFSSLGIAEELNYILQPVKNLVNVQIRKIEVPNLNVNIYEVQINGEILLFTNYNNVFSLNKPITSEQLMPILKEEAYRFNKEFGKTLKKEKLVY